MFTGFEKIVEARIKKAQKEGVFNELQGTGTPIVFEDDYHIPEDLKLAHKILKNADCLPPEVEVRKDIRQTEDLLSDLKDTKQQYRVLKKLNFLIMKLNALRDSNVSFDMPQQYMDTVAERMASNSKDNKA